MGEDQLLWILEEYPMCGSNCSISGGNCIWIRKVNVSMDYDPSSMEATDEFTHLNAQYVQHALPLDNVKYIFPSKAECAEKFDEAGLDVPDFLRNENHPEYIPPHLVLMYVLQKRVLHAAPGSGRY